MNPECVVPMVVEKPKDPNTAQDLIENLVSFHQDLSDIQDDYVRQYLEIINNVQIGHVFLYIHTFLYSLSPQVLGSVRMDFERVNQEAVNRRGELDEFVLVYKSLLEVKNGKATD